MEALAGDGEGHLVPTPVRREKIKASKRELALEADRVLKQADSVASLHSDVPPRRQQRSKPDGGSLQRKTSFGGTDSKKWNSEGKSHNLVSKIIVLSILTSLHVHVYRMCNCIVAIRYKL